MTHDIPEDVPNSTIEYCISEYVRLERDRAILREHWFCGASFYVLAERYGVTINTVKRVVYSQGDKVLLRAAKIYNRKMT